MIVASLFRPHVCKAWAGDRSGSRRCRRFSRDGAARALVCRVSSQALRVEEGVKTLNGVVAAGEHFVAFVQGGILEDVDADAEFPSAAFHALLHGAAERIRIAIEINGICLGFTDERFEDGVRVALANDQAPALRLEVPGERSQAAAQKLLPRRVAPVVFVPAIC